MTSQSSILTSGYINGDDLSFTLANGQIWQATVVPDGSFSGGVKGFHAGGEHDGFFSTSVGNAKLITPEPGSLAFFAGFAVPALIVRLKRGNR